MKFFKAFCSLSLIGSKHSILLRWYSTHVNHVLEIVSHERNGTNNQLTFEQGINKNHHRVKRYAQVHGRKEVFVDANLIPLPGLIVPFGLLGFELQHKISYIFLLRVSTR